MDNFRPPLLTNFKPPVTNLKPSLQALIERLNLTLRHDNNRLSRKTIGFSKKIEAQMLLYFANFNFCRAHGSLKHRDNYGRVSMNCPAKEYGLIDHNWSLKELLIYPYHAIPTD